MLVLLIQFGPNGQSQTPFDPTTDDGTSGTGGTGSGGTGGTGGGTGGTGGGSTYSGGSTDRRDAPIDGGLAFLLAAGIGYGVKRARKSIKNRG